MGFYHTTAILNKSIVFVPLASLEQFSIDAKVRIIIDFILLGLKMAARDKSPWKTTEILRNKTI
jgi:hypothetical protein